MRQSNFELLRGVLMFMVIGFHVIGRGILDKDSPVPIGSTNYFNGNLLESFFVMAVDCFILISGYWGIRASFKKLLTLYLPILFYSIILYLIIGYLNSDFDLNSFLYFCIPFTSAKWWFVAQYILLFLFSPLLNKILTNIKKRELESALLIGGFLFVLLPTFTPFSLTRHDRGFGIINFILLYLVGYYLRHFWNKNLRRYTYLVSYVLSCACVFTFNYLAAKYLNHNRGWASKFYGYDTLFVYSSAISFFMYFKSLNIKSSTINKLSPSFFYIYIIHEHSSVREVLYEKLGCPNYYDSPYLIFHALFSCVIIFAGCLIIDLLRRFLFSKIEGKLVSALDVWYQKGKNQLRMSR
jgi:surface polysaccharide O-acyltransferase-like enzyme